MVETRNGCDKMINLFEAYNKYEISLETSLFKAGYQHQTVVLSENGFLPEHVVSPVSFFTGMNLQNLCLDKGPKFFNDVQVPNYWEIIGDNNKADIFEGYKKRGVIHYSKRDGDFRLIESIEWLNESEQVRTIDLYNQYGYIFGRHTYSDGELVSTSYFDSSFREILSLNHITSIIQLKYQKKMYIFKSFNDFILFYFEAADLDTKNIFYNSLGRPFFIANALKEYNPSVEYSHTLFWQEESREMPGNMSALLYEEGFPTHHIIVQNKAEYDRLLKQIKEKITIKFNYLGYINSFKREPIVGKSIFILTNSDQIAHLVELVTLLSNYQIKIAAKTEMSQKLMEFEQFSNVQLYPNITPRECEKLISLSNIYLDINYGNEVDNIIWKAFENNLLSFAFNQTNHNKQYIDYNNIFDLEDLSGLVNKINEVSENPDKFFLALQNQVIHGGQVSVDNYKEVLI